MNFGRKWGEALPLQPGLPAPGVPKGTRGPEQGGIDVWTFVGSVHRAELESSKNNRGATNIDFSNLASCILLLFSAVDLTQQPGQIWVNFCRTLRFLESCQDWSGIIQESSKSHLEVIRAF